MNHRPNPFQRFLHRFLMLQPVSKILARILQPVDEFTRRLTRGKHTVTELVGLPVIELETIGARSGQPRSHPLIGIHLGEKIVLIGSNFGNQRHPAWVHNLRAHPECFVQANGHTGSYLARETNGDERADYWALALDYYKGYAAYEKRAAPRKISVWILEPISDPMVE